MMQVRDLMTRMVDSIRTDQSVGEAAILMRDRDLGALPVFEQGRLVGIVTDRDLTVRGLAEGRSPDSPVGPLATRKIHTCYPEDDLEEALRMMADEQVRRLPVCDASGHLLGMVTLADAARHARRSKEVALTLAEICMPFGDHCQSAPRVACDG